MTDWEAWRPEFPTLAKVTYLNSCSLGCLSRRVRAAVDAHLDLWEARGASAWYGPWVAETEAARQSFAALVNAREDEVALFPNVSTFLAVVASALPVDERDEVLAADMDFPTLVHAFQARPGVTVRLAKGDGVRVAPEAVEAMLSPRTGLLATSHVLFSSGAVQDVARLARAARAAGALSLVDAYQATGQLPTDVKAIGCDMLVTGGLKWLLGGTGVVFAYVSRAAQERLRPTLAGWFGHARQFDFDPAFARRDDARGWELGTPGVAAVYAGRAGLDLVREIGAARIRARQVELGRDLVERLVDAGFALGCPTGDEERAGIVTVRATDPRAVVARLAEGGVIVDARPGVVRLSPYFYNTPAENEAAVGSLRRAVR